MEIKGTAFVARKAMLERKFGAARFDAVLRAQVAVDPLFGRPILATTRLPIDAFMRLNERIVKELYAGDDHSYWEAGQASAEFALGESGPYRVLVTSRDVKAFAESAPRIYRTYFDEGDALGELRPDGVVLLTLTGIPYRHVYFEYAICGYFAHGLSLVSGKKVDTTCVRGFSRGDADVRYELRLR
jgi:hypothetical protein